MCDSSALNQGDIDRGFPRGRPHTAPRQHRRAQKSFIWLMPARGKTTAPLRPSQPKYRHLTIPRPPSQPPTPSFPVPPAARSNKKFIGPFSSFAAGITGMIEANDVVSDALESDASPCSS